MNARGRMFIDVSYTRTQGAPVGITRVVRALARALPAVPVIFHPHGFRLFAGSLQAGPAPSADMAGLFRRLLGNRMRAVAAWLPLPVLNVAFTAATGWIFRRLGRDGTAVTFGPGDIVLLADESWNYPVWRAAAAARRSGAYVVLVLYDFIPLRQREFCAPLFSLVFARWLPRILAATDAVVCISRATQSDYRAYCEAHGLAELPSAPVRLGADAADGSPEGSVRPELARFAGDGAPCFAMVGTIEPRKNHALALEVFEGLWSAGTDVHWLVAGKVHPASESFVARLRAHPENGKRLMVFHDASDAEIAAVYERSRALLFPTLAEGFGLPLVEARTRGCPVIASRLPALEELADAGVFLHAPGDAAQMRALVDAHARSERRTDTPAMPLFTWKQTAAALRAAIDGFGGARAGVR